MFCQKCGKEIADDAQFCQFCGQQVNGAIQPQQVVIVKQERQQKSQFVAIVLCLFLGMIGIHDFYLGRNGAGVTKTLVLALFGWIYIGVVINVFWCFFDFIAILCKAFEALKSNEELEKERQDIEDYNKRKEEYEKQKAENEIWK